MKDNISKAVSGKNNPMYNVHRFGKNAPNWNKPQSELAKRKIGKANKGKCIGKKNGMFGKIAHHGNGSYYKNIWMRSSWEIAYAKWLDIKSIKWKYEYTTFNLGNTTYTPDFYLINNNKYIEIKGRWFDDAKKKFNKFRKLYSKINIEILDFKKLKKMNII